MELDEYCVATIPKRHRARSFLQNDATCLSDLILAEAALIVSEKPTQPETR